MSKSGGEKAPQKTVRIVSRQTMALSVPSVAGTATPELVFTATTDAVQWVQIYDLSRLTDANDAIEIDDNNH